MLRLRKSADRGHANHGWLRSHHSFSFADYVDPAHKRFGVLRVINEDFIQGGQGFGTHPHQDMEILTYMLSGELEHKDSLGTHGVIRRGEMQRMSAGTGIEHSEFNHSPSVEAHLLQIWLFPSLKGIAPSYEQKSFAEPLKEKGFVLVASPSGAQGSLTIHQDTLVYAAQLREGQSLNYDFNKERLGWLQVASGTLRVGDTQLKDGDGLAISQEQRLELTSVGASEFLLFDLPPDPTQK